MAGRTLLPLPTAALEAVGEPFGADVLPPVEVYLPEVLGLAELSSYTSCPQNVHGEGSEVILPSQSDFQIRSTTVIMSSIRPAS